MTHRVPDKIAKLARETGVRIFAATARRSEEHFAGTYYNRGKIIHAQGDGLGVFVAQAMRDWRLSAKQERQLLWSWRRRIPYIVYDPVLGAAEQIEVLLLHEVAHHIIVRADESGRESTPTLRRLAKQHLSLIPGMGDYEASNFDETAAESLAYYLCDMPLPAKLRKLAERLLRKAGLSKLIGKPLYHYHLTVVHIVTGPVALPRGEHYE